MAAGNEVWKLIFELVRNLSEVLLQTLPSFWKVAKGYMDGKYRKVCRINLVILHYLTRDSRAKHLMLVLEIEEVLHNAE